MKILGIETSCDETAVAIVDDQKCILSHVIKSQIDLHRKFGGVVPDLAARSHTEVIDVLILESLKQAKIELSEIDAFAATCGPGLIGGVIVGMMAAKTLASIFKKPFLAINHLEGHALTVRLTSDIKFPYLLLLLSGGHCQILFAHGVGDYKKIGETIDDALGEAFDKVAKMIDLPYPGGPEVESCAVNGNENRFKFSRPLIDKKNKEHLFDFSFSGLKTAVRREIEKLIGEDFCHLTSPKKINEQDKRDICASFQRVVCEVIVNRLDNVFSERAEVKDFLKLSVDQRNLVIAGGVAANRYIFSRLQNWALKHQIKIVTPPLNLCTDNAAMIAWVGIEKMRLSRKNYLGENYLGDGLDFKAAARWPLPCIEDIYQNTLDFG